MAFFWFWYTTHHYYSTAPFHKIIQNGRGHVFCVCFDFSRPFFSLQLQNQVRIHKEPSKKGAMVEGSLKGTQSAQRALQGGQRPRRFQLLERTGFLQMQDTFFFTKSKHKMELGAIHLQADSEAEADSIGLRPVYRPEIFPRKNRPINWPEANSGASLEADCLRPIQRPVQRPIHDRPVQKPIHVRPVQKPIHQRPIHRKPIHGQTHRHCFQNDKDTSRVDVTLPFLETPIRQKILKNWYSEQILRTLWLPSSSGTPPKIELTFFGRKAQLEGSFMYCETAKVCRLTSMFKYYRNEPPSRLWGALNLSKVLLCF